MCIIIRKILISVCHYFQRSQTVTHSESGGGGDDGDDDDGLVRVR